ncbi:hypothetical protein [Flavobacterium mesophilum]|uniref:hypothetical protein n=1 Tax=Flavobacterium mesophilum TaxID=3143495 RepID=UPI0031CF83C7
MDSEDIELRKKIDLHYGKRNGLHTINYVEFYFHACFFEILNVENSYWETSFDGTEIAELLDFLNINFDKEYIIEKYIDPKNHDVEVLHSKNDEQVFAYFDLEKDPTDQNDMFLFGIRCLKKDDLIVAEKLLKIYKKLGTSSPFSFDIHNNRLYNKVFNSYFYFYDNNYDTRKRQINYNT